MKTTPHRTAVEKIAQRHLCGESDDVCVRSGDFVSLRPLRIMTHDNTSAVMRKFRSIGVGEVFDPRQPVFALDHNIQDRSEQNLARYAEVESFAAEHGITFHPAGAGIGHQVMIEGGHVLPGTLVVAADSHANIYGALGALGTPVTRSDAAAVWATGEFWWQVPPSIRVHLTGTLGEDVGAKDLILTLLGRYREGEVLNAAVEFCGPGVASLTMDARMTIANMTTEWGALAGIFPSDESTRRFFAERGIAIGEGQAISADPEAHYASEIEVDLDEISPVISGPHSLRTVTALHEIEARRIAIHKAYLLSCVNSRYEDLEAAAKVIEDRSVAPGVAFYVAAASREIQERAESSGLWDIFRASGARFLPPGCGPCIGLGSGLLEKGETAVSATNRNFRGRMGARESTCYIASPEVVAASAVAGRIEGPAQAPPPKASPSPKALRKTRDKERENGSQVASARPTKIVDGFPHHLRGRMLLLPHDHIDTDGIFSKDLIYRVDATPAMMADAVMRNYDPSFADLVREGDIIVAGRNFGTGSSREQAVTALQSAGVAMVIAESFSQTYLRNAFNNGFVCIAVPAFVQAAKVEVIRTGDVVTAEAATIVSESCVEVDFSRGMLFWNDRNFSFAPLGAVPQALVASGGLVPFVRTKLGLSHPTPEPAGAGEGEKVGGKRP